MSIKNKKISLIFKRKSLHHMMGAYRSNFKWTGLSFAESRLYTAGDPYNRIDRRTSAKKQELYLKQYEEERMLRVFVVVSWWASMYFSTVFPTKLHYIEMLWTKIGELAVLQWDTIWFYIDTPSDEIFFPWKKWRQNIKKRRTTIINFSEKAFSRQHPLENTALRLAPYRLHHSLIIRISDQCVSENDKHVHALAKNNDLLYINLLDPFEIHPDPNLLWSTAVRVQSSIAQWLLSQWWSVQNVAELIRKRLTESERLLSSWWITSIIATTQDDPELTLIKLFKKHKLKQ